MLRTPMARLALAGCALPAGTYFVRVRTDAETIDGRIVRVR